MSISIRPLQTTDLRVRRISGRHQISADGKHLIDGVAFGRPYLRRVDRPAVRIPPRKRRRIAYDVDDDNEDVSTDEGVHDRQMVLRAGFNDADELILADESDDEQDFLPDDEAREDLEAELKDLQDESQAGAGEDGRPPAKSGAQKPITRSMRRSQRSPQGLGLLELLDENGQPFVGEYSNPLLDQYSQAEYSARHQPLEMTKRHPLKYTQGADRSSKHGVQDSSVSPEIPSRRGSSGSSKNVHLEDAGPATPVTIRQSQSSDADDDDYDPGEVDESDKENAEPRTEEVNSSEVRVISVPDIQGKQLISSQSSSSSSRSSSLTFSKHSDSDETSSSGSSSSDTSSDSDSGPERRSMKTPNREGDNSSTSSTSSSNISDSESEPEPEPEPRTKPNRVRKSKARTGDTQAQGGKERKQPKSIAASIPAAKTVPPGQGKKQTMSRNMRRKEQKNLNYLKQLGTLPAGATIADLRKYKASQEASAAYINRPEADPDAFSAKRDALLASIATGGIEIDPTTGVPEPTREELDVNDQPVEEHQEIEVAPLQQSASKDEVPIQEAYQDKTMVDERLNAAEIKEPEKAVPAQPPDKLSEAALDDSPQHRRSKLNVDGARRMLFGSLGLKTPKTKQDEMRTREKLMKDVRPVREPQAEPETESLEDIAADDSWKDKVDLRAVECCHEGITLSTPPFPFVQRWDPQQQRGYRNNNQKRKGKKRKRNNSDYYDGSYEDSYGKMSNYDENQGPESESKVLHSGYVERSQDNNPSIVDQGIDDSQAVNSQLLRENGEASAGTLREISEQVASLEDLSKDPTACPSLTREAIQEGTVIAFKQLEMSAETKWQPRISDYRTAVIEQITDDGILQMIPAIRDRRNKQIQYDDLTGERLYSKFEMPGYSDEDGDDLLEISFDELISPVLVRNAENKFKDCRNQENQNHDLSVENTQEGDSKAAEALAENNAQPSKESREEISEMIRDAGWRSSVQSGINKDMLPLVDPNSQGKGNDQDDTTLIDVPSPSFNQFSSSPFVHVRSSPPIAEDQSPKRPHASGTEIAESIPPPDDDDSIVTDNKSAVEYPSLPHLGDDSEILHEEAQRRSDPIVDLQSLSQDLVSNDIEHPLASSACSYREPSQENSASRPFHSNPNPTESEDEFPEPFSQAWETRLSQDIDIKPEFSQEDVISPPSYRKSKAIGNRASSQRESNRSWKPDGAWSPFEDNQEDADDGASTPRPTQKQKSLQIVDLLTSSDGVDPGLQNGDEDSYKLPKGPGWVKKAKARKVKTKTKSR